MSIRPSWLAATLLSSCVFVTALPAQNRPRITGPVNDAAVVRLEHTTHPLANSRYDTGRAIAGLPMDRMILVLKSSPDQEATLERLLLDQQDPSSPQYHQWLTPEEFGRQFGPAQEDIDTVVRWLQDHGFTVNSVAPGHRTIEFSGAVRQVEDAFQTEMHHYAVNGVRHLANASEIAIPDALADVVGGVASLNDFHKRPFHTVRPPVPEANLSGGSHAIGPYDFATIYNLAPLWSSSFDGTGQSIAIAGRTNIKLSDVTTFRSMFGLTGNNTQVILNGADPGVVSSDEETEADLDVEWSGAVAKGATINFVVSASTNTSDGVDLSAQYIVNNNVAPVVSLSFGACESEMGSGNQFYNNLWSQAAAQGMSVFVAAGDSGSAGCDDPSSNRATLGLAVNGLASTPYDVAVGGTQFLDSPAATYWNTSNDAHVASAKSYIPETVWNETSGGGLWAGSGGVSIVYSTPAWQTGTGVPTVDPGTTTQHHRYLPDVSLTAAGHDGYLVEQEGALELIGGTSASTPAFAGIMAIVNQYTGGRNGNPNLHFYPIAAHAASVYHDVSSGTNAVPCRSGTPNCVAGTRGTSGVESGFNATAGYDLATGWGSVDANALALNWGGSQPPTSPTITALSPSPMTGSSSNQTLTITGSGFQSGASVKASYTGFSTTLAVTSVTATQIKATINVGTTARTWSIQVVNPGNVASNTASLQVTAPVVTPSITALSPNPMTGASANQTLTIQGTNFGTGAIVQASYPGFSTNLTVTSLTATQIQATINVGITARSWTIRVTNPGNLSSNSATLQVNAPAAPSITSLTPNPMTGSRNSQVLTINGTGFQTGNGLTVRLVSGNTTIQVQGFSLSATATQIRAAVNVGITAQKWNVQVINPNGQASNTAVLTVTAGH
ncbi:MAG TPA: protease pro-enzyme activation domain-containing protein [Bryobacteraceae bacterium]|nr:protease pro-enzyme activation domain-containing protein [Bryobacteraceae bacterium]